MAARLIAVAGPVPKTELLLDHGETGDRGKWGQQNVKKSVRTADELPFAQIKVR
jgi:hypothetical protein